MGSLIHKDFVFIVTLTGIVGKTVFRYQVNLATKQTLKVAPHAKKFKTYRLRMVQIHHQVYVTFSIFFTTRKGAK